MKPTHLNNRLMTCSLLITLAFISASVLMGETAFAHGDEHGGGADLSQFRRKKKSRLSAKVGLSFSDKIASGFKTAAPLSDGGITEQGTHGQTPGTVNPETQPHQHDEGTNLHTANTLVNDEAGSHTVAVHSHDHSSAHGFGRESTKLIGQLRYSFAPKWDVTGNVAASVAEGLDDPSTSLGLTQRFDSNWLMRATTSASFPASKESQELTKTTTITPGLALAFQKRRWTFSANAAVGLSYYQKSQLASADDQAATSASTHKLAQKPGHAGGEGTTGSEEAHDRERVRYMSGTQLNYRLTAKLSAGGGFDVARTYWESDDPTWLTSATIARIGYQIDQVNSSVGFGVQKEDHTFSFPTDPLVRLLVQYSY